MSLAGGIGGCRCQAGLRGLLCGGMLVLGVAGCAADAEKDLRYQQSHLLAPLEIPAGLSPPERTGYLEIPAASPGDQSARVQGGAVDARPPDILDNE